MKRILKKLLILVCALGVVFAMSGCGKKVETFEVNEAQIRADVKSLTGLMTYFDEEIYNSQIKDLEPDQVKNGVYYSTANPTTGAGVSVDGQAFKDGLLSFIEAKKELGNFSANSIGDENIVIVPGDEVTVVTIGVTGDGKDPSGNPRVADIEYTLDRKGNITSLVTNIRRPLSENMQNAALNTLLGMGTVFVVLIVIALIINCFKFISIAEAKMKQKKDAPKEKAEAMDSAVAQIIENEERTDDLELIAVITAAIAAYEGNTAAPTGDGYVVRSIKRVR